jgi:hypothetical protein
VLHSSARSATFARRGDKFGLVAAFDLFFLISPCCRIGQLGVLGEAFEGEPQARFRFAPMAFYITRAARRWQRNNSGRFSKRLWLNDLRRTILCTLHFKLGVTPCDETKRAM